MTSQRPGEQSIFLEALEKTSEAQRAAYLAAACGNDQRLRDGVEALLRAHEQTHDLLDDPASAVAALSLDVMEEQVGTVIGRYSLVQRLGEGGMGSVYLAEQRSPVHRQVALKIIKPGMDTRQVIARFEAERQALALMDHPHIAHVFDAGATEGGRPYFVMEPVLGIPLTQYCDGARLTVRQRLELFLPVCEAVLHAHQKGIIHRDIKPSNILVAIRDGVAVPKIIDFGMAKAIGPVSLGQPSATQLGQVVGTPLYMSPEQAEGSGRSVDTRTDIYSLGVVLYELLTGTTPCEKERFLDARYEQICAAIREEDPPRPSERISTLDLPAASTISERRRTDRVRLRSVLRGDLDWIVMKALEKDPERRYATARDLADDLLRFLKGEPASAKPPSWLDWLVKWGRRHRSLVWGSVVMSLVLSLVLGTSTALLLQQQRELFEQRNYATDQSRRAQQAEQAARAQQAIAQKAAATAQEINRFVAEDILGQADPHRRPAGDAVTLLEVLDQASQRIDQALGDQPEIRCALHRTIAQAYSGLGEYEKSATHYRAALQLGGGPGKAPAETMSDQVKLAEALKEAGDWGEAERLVRESLETIRQTLGVQHHLVLDALGTLSDVARLQETEGASAELPKLLGEHLAAAQRAFGQDHPAALKAQQLQAQVLYRAGNEAEAEKLCRQVLEARRRVLGADHRDTLETADYLGRVLHGARKLGEAEQLMRATLEVKRRVYGPDDPSTHEGLNSLAIVLAYQGEYAEAETLFRQAIEASRHRLGVDHPDTLTLVTNLSWVLMISNRLKDAEQLFRDNWQEIGRKRGPQHESTITTGTELGFLLLHQGKYRQAELVGRTCLAAAHESLGLEHTERGRACDDVRQGQRVR